MVSASELWGSQLRPGLARSRRFSLLDPLDRRLPLLSWAHYVIANRQLSSANRLLIVYTLNPQICIFSSSSSLCSPLLFLSSFLLFHYFEALLEELNSVKFSFFFRRFKLELEFERRRIPFPWTIFLFESFDIFVDSSKGNPCFVVITENWLGLCKGKKKWCRKVQACPSGSSSKSKLGKWIFDGRNRTRLVLSRLHYIALFHSCLVSSNPNYLIAHLKYKISDVSLHYLYFLLWNRSVRKKKFNSKSTLGSLTLIDLSYAKQSRLHGLQWRNESFQWVVSY